jgi:hypothetical protein
VIIFETLGTIHMAVELSNNQSAKVVGPCALAECQRLAVAVLDGQPLCLDHFFSRCYAALADFDQYRDYARVDREQIRSRLRNFLEECSAQALNISLRVQNMSNLQRARLLDVLLWAGELSEFVSLSKNKSFPAVRTTQPRRNLTH